MSLFDDLAQYKTGGFPADYAQNVRRFYSPQDEVHSALKCLLNSVTSSLLVSMYGEDDSELTQIIIEKAENPDIFVQVNLDKTQAAGKAESALVAQLKAAPNTRVAIGTSQFHKINHLKMAVCDGLSVLSGSTNWSGDGEAKQNNECSIFQDRAIAHEATTILNTEHQTMLSQTESAP